MDQLLSLQRDISKNNHSNNHNQIMTNNEFSYAENTKRGMG